MVVCNRNPMLSKTAISEYQEIYKRTYGVDISSEEAQLQGERLLRLFNLLSRKSINITFQDVNEYEKTKTRQVE
jgi:aldehyde:ferredoxin oxidoreductase